MVVLHYTGMQSAAEARSITGSLHEITSNDLLRIGDAIFETLRALAPQPLLVVLEHLGSADEDTRFVFAHLTRRVALESERGRALPLGFAAAILGALAFPSRRSEEMFDEVYVRQNTGLGMAKAIDH